MTSEALTDLQLAVMQALWRIGEGSVADVLEAMAGDGKDLAPTTVATLLQRLSSQGWVAYDKRGRHFIYRARVAQRDAARGALGRLLQGFFGGSVSALTAQLLESDELTKAELRAMQDLLKKTKGPAR
jgi:predicted transcriptional regulator